MSVRHLLPVLLLLGSCSTWMPAAPEHSLQTPLGTAFGNSPDAASRLVDSWMRIAPSIQLGLPGSKADERVDIWLVDQDEIPDPFNIGHPMGGITYSVGGDAKLIQVPDTHKLDWVLAHELTHALLGPEWNTLGGVLEEGLCEYMGSLSAPQLKPVRMLQVHMGAAALYGYDQAGLFFARAERQEDDQIEMKWLGEKGNSPEQIWQPSDLPFYLGLLDIGPYPELRAGLQRLGTFLVLRIVERIGLEGLHEMCVRAEYQDHDVIPFAWIMRAADLDPDGERLLPELLRPLRARSAHRLFREHGVEIGRYIASEYASHFVGWDGPNFVHFSAGTFRSIDGRNLALFDYEPIRTTTRNEWPLRKNSVDQVMPPFVVTW